MTDSFVPQVRVTDTGAGPSVTFLPTAYRPVGAADGVPSPYAHLLAGLGACTTMTLRMYAARQSWPLEGIAVDLQHQKIAIAQTTDKTDHFTRIIALSGPVTDEQKAKLLEIAQKCPVSRMLVQASQIVSRLGESLACCDAENRS